ncbi:hypothetical protein [Streptomyces orinoci]|uniref:SIS domain-containing protein n=1 Tax=Streptomyces orinoci TaxID=67339 RepID=A0ABV3JVG8_STRON|nr:hypothetical protein [Streptomyces orinoci]
MDAVRVALLREVLAGAEWLQATRRFAGALRRSAGGRGGELLLLGSAAYEPWHLAAHLDEEAARSGLPELSPTLVRHRVPPAAPAHLSVGLDRLREAGRGETLLVVLGRTGPDPGAELLERVHQVRRGGATVLTLDGAPEGAHREMRALAHEALSVPPDLEPDFDLVQHLLSAAAGEPVPPAAPGRGRRFRDQLSRLAEQLTAPPPDRW